MGNWFQCCFLSVTWEHNESWNARQMEVAYVSLVARWDKKKKKNRMAANTCPRAHTDTHRHTNTNTNWHTWKKKKPKKTNAVNISPLASANYELDSLRRQTYTRLNLAAPRTHTVSQWCKTQKAEDPTNRHPPRPHPPTHPEGEVPEYRLDDSTL